MRTFFGYLMVILMLPLFILVVQLFHVEWENVIPVTSMIEDKVRLSANPLSTLSMIKSDDGTTFSAISTGETRIYLPFAKIPQLAKDTFVVSEDRSFFKHDGVDVSAIARAFIENARHNSIEEGGSTITQQLARNLYLTQEKTYNRKFSELLYAYQIEKRYSKNQILEQYINAIYFDNSVYGIEAAARYYFDTTAGKLSPAQIILLAAIPNNPSLYDPFRHPEQAKHRQERLINQLVQQNKLTKQQGSAIAASPIHLKKGTIVDLYPDYAAYVEREFKQLVADQEGFTQALNSNDLQIRAKAEKRLDIRVKDVLASGVSIYTSLDQRIQTRAQNALQTYLPDKETEGATAVILHDTHELVSLTGAKEYKKYSFHRGYQSYRQPGSAIKPLLVYAPYLELTGAGIDELINAGPFCSKSYCPENYNHARYGYVTIRQAFAHSYNTPAVRLFQKAGIQKSFAYLNAFRFKKITAADYALPAAIGGFTYGMSPLELTSAYTSFADGSYQQPVAIKYVKDSSGHTLYSWHKPRTRVWSDKTLQKMRTLLHSPMTEGTAVKANIPSAGYIGGKTGTTNDYKDLWMVGLDKHYTAGVWVGKDSPGSLQYTKAPHLAVWKAIMSEIH
ncbi:transglycosylase domain-containing protein [Bacillus testis]|uniref:transglycosylase domain-containing protein n=1 Tax=Bacillus testis TaxID=1622072 RepID=UPI00067F1D1B|nr:transglycosylase domain-containing protein [Bacillus testis]